MKKIIIGMLVIIILAIIVKIQIDNKPTEYATREYTITNKETLWSIAEMYAPEGMDIREYIYYIKQDNNIESTIYANQVIIIRIYEERGDN